MPYFAMADVCEKVEDISALVTAKAIIGLPLGVDVETGSFFVMKRAQRFPCAARALERYVRLNEFNDVVCLADLFHQFRANEPTHKSFRGWRAAIFLPSTPRWLAGGVE